jgi:hypothetical protein
MQDGMKAIKTSWLQALLTSCIHERVTSWQLARRMSEQLSSIRAIYLSSNQS